MKLKFLKKNGGGAGDGGGGAAVATKGAPGGDGGLEAELSEALVETGEYMEKLDEKVDALAAATKGVVNLDGKAIKEGVDKLLALEDQRQKAVIESKGGNDFGIENVHKKFSVIRAINARKSGDWSGAKVEQTVIEETKALVKAGSINVGDDNSAGFMVPDEVLPDVVDSTLRKSRLVNLTGEAGDGETIVTMYDGLVGGTVTINKYEGGLVAYWLGEEDSIVNSIVNTEDLKMEPNRLGVLVRLTDAMMKFSSPRLEASIRRDMVRALAKKLDVTGFYGKGGAHSPRGILSHPEIKIYRAENKTVYATPALAAAAASWTGANLDYDGLDNMKGALEEDDIDPSDTERLISSPAFFRRLKQLKVANYSGQTTEQPYLTMIPMMTDAKLAEIIGPFLKSNNFVSSGKAGATIGAPASGGGTSLKFGDVIHGDFKEYIFGRWSGIEITTDGGVGVGFPNGRTFLRATMYCDFQVRQPRAFIACVDAQVRA